ncbi:putative monomeric alkaline phosphatase PhoX [Escherichia coli]|uniref:Putative monomeric alkaline phosphatase PhoX n=1 Tax=Escherichia coli TaxID=562 RepID=A0A376MP11_ECOLX|nr:putative monomeric alkaline phosphatase PhoX [Escherichia coli]
MAMPTGAPIKLLKARTRWAVSVIEVKKVSLGWEVVRPSSFARRITVNTPMKITGPALHNPLMQTVDDPKGEIILGTMQNCANGFTPWGHLSDV